MDSPNDDGQPLQWKNYLILAVFMFVGSTLGGWVNRRANRPNHEEIVGKIEQGRQETQRLRDEVKELRNRP